MKPLLCFLIFSFYVWTDLGMALGSASKSISQRVSNFIDRSIRVVPNSLGYIMKICKMNKNMNV